jgi:hypothetical protein
MGNKSTRRDEQYGTMIRPISRTMLFLLLLFSVANGLPLLGGIFETTTDVQGILNLGRDVAGIQQSDDKAQQESIYINVSLR